MTLLVDVMKDLDFAVEGLRSGKLSSTQAKEINNNAGKKIAIVKTHLEFSKQARCEPTAEFYSKEQQRLAKEAQDARKRGADFVPPQPSARRNSKTRTAAGH